MTDGGASICDLDASPRSPLGRRRQCEAFAALKGLGFQASSTILARAPNKFLAKSADNLGNANIKLGKRLESGTLSPVHMVLSRNGHVAYKVAFNRAVDAISLLRDIKLFTCPVRTPIDAGNPLGRSILFSVFVETRFYLTQRITAQWRHAMQLIAESSIPSFTLSEALAAQMGAPPKYFAREILSHEP